MASLEDRLDPEQFARVHRSTIVNLDRVKEIQPWFKGDYLVVLRDGTQLSLTRQYRDRLPG
jgi:two-component system LytT family response regulator